MERRKLLQSIAALAVMPFAPLIKANPAATVPIADAEAKKAALAAFFDQPPVSMFELMKEPANLDLIKKNMTYFDGEEHRSYDGATYNSPA